MFRAAPFAVFCAILPCAAFQLRTGDVYDWRRQDLAGGMEATVLVSVLGASVPEGRCADSARAWSLRLEPDWAPAETVQVLEFPDGALRWSRWSSRFFPVELQDPREAQTAWGRCDHFWGMGEVPMRKSYTFSADSFRVTYESIPLDSAGDWGASAVNRMWIDPPGDYVFPFWMNSARGIWVDSIGPLRHSWAGAIIGNPVDWVLQARNGVPVEWTNPRMDSVRRFGSRDDRLGNFRIPLTGSRFRWRHTRWLISTKNVQTLTNVDLRVSDGGPDSAGWTCRVFEFQETDAKGASVGWRETRRWNSQGRQIVVGARYPVLEGAWRLDPEDQHSSWRYTRMAVEPGWGGYVASYLPTGVLDRTEYQSSDSIAPGVTGQAAWELLWDSSVVVGVTPRSPHGAAGVSARALAELEREHPDAVVELVGVSGRGARLSLGEFLRTRPAPGIRSVRVLARGKVLAQGLRLDP